MTFLEILVILCALLSNETLGEQHEKALKLQSTENNPDSKEVDEMKLEIQSLKQEVESLKSSRTILYILVSICLAILFLVPTAICLICKGLVLGGISGPPRE